VNENGFEGMMMPGLINRVRMKRRWERNVGASGGIPQ